LQHVFTFSKRLFKLAYRGNFLPHPLINLFIGKSISCDLWFWLAHKHSRILVLANHPHLHTPGAATAWASCLFAVDDENLK